MPDITYDFEEVNEETVNYLSKTNESLLPSKSVNVTKDNDWITKSMNSQILQGILAGEPIDDISKRLQSVVSMSSKSAIRNARTMTTGAQNRGRLDSYKEAMNNGVDLDKVWISTPDDRTRVNHAALDGQVRKVDEKFSVSTYELSYPGDSSCAPEMVYNCRCSMKTKINGFKFNDNSGFNISDWSNKNMSNVFTEIKCQNTTLANSFYKELQKYGKPSEVWKKYLNGELDPDANAKIESFLKQVKNVSKTPVMSKGGKKDSKKEAPSEIKKSGFDASLYSKTEKINAIGFSSREQADKFYRPWLDKVWNLLSDKEKYSVWLYTRDSDPINQPLSGYDGSWFRSSFVGLLKSKWSLNDKKKQLYGEFSKFGLDNHPVYHDAISSLTKAIDKSTLNKSCYLVRGSDADGLAGLLEGDLFSFDEAKNITKMSEKNIKKLLEGETFVSHSFLSTAIAKDSGYNGEVTYSIYAPKGTKCIYAEPQSRFGGTATDHLYVPGEKYSSVGEEAEIIIQRGTAFRITSVNKFPNGNIHVEMEVVGQPDYFTYGDENTADGGKTRHKK